MQTSASKHQQTRGGKGGREGGLLCSALRNLIGEQAGGRPKDVCDETGLEVQTNWVAQQKR